MIAEHGRVGGCRDELLHLALADRLTVGPGGDLLDLARQRAHVVPDEMQEGGAGVGLGPDALLPEPIGDPLLQTALGDVEHEQAFAPDRLGQRRVLLHAPDRRARAPSPGEGDARYATTACDVGGFPAVAQLTLGVRPAVDVVDDDQPAVTEEASCVAKRDDVGARALDGGDELDRLGREMRHADVPRAVSIFGLSLPLIR